jgi:hypothetical protein
MTRYESYMSHAEITTSNRRRLPNVYGKSFPPNSNYLKLTWGSGPLLRMAWTSPLLDPEFIMIMIITEILSITFALKLTQDEYINALLLSIYSYKIICISHEFYYNCIDIKITVQMNIKTYFIITKLSDLPFMDIILLC